MFVLRLATEASYFIVDNSIQSEILSYLSSFLDIDLKVSKKYLVCLNNCFSYM